MKRKIIQIAATSATNDLDEGWCERLALCDDGTVWVMEGDTQSKYASWNQLPDIPQPKEDEGLAGGEQNG